MRAWARDNGYTVAERGRIPAEVRDAYTAAHRRGSGGRAGTARPAAGRTAAKATAARKTGTPDKAAAAPQPDVPPPAAPAARSTEQGSPSPKPKPVSDDRRLVALGEQIAALTERVTALEAATKGKGGKPDNGRASRFRRSK